MREHGGDLDRAISLYGGTRQSWLDLSTGINPHAYHLPDIAQDCWANLPDHALFETAERAAQKAYNTDARCVPLAGAQQAIQLYPSLVPKGGNDARLLNPTYNEHEAQLKRHGWQVSLCENLDDLRGADCAVVVNPNNPDGQVFSPQQLATLGDEVGTLIIDESFCDPHPEASLLPRLDKQMRNCIILRSFGKFYGLAGMRLGFVCGTGPMIEAMADGAGKWNVSGPALVVGSAALQDVTWRDEMISRLAQEANQLDDIVCAQGLTLVGGTTLFRLYEADDARAIQDQLAKNHIWSRIFSYNPKWIRLGLPDAIGWARLEDALKP